MRSSTDDPQPLTIHEDNKVESSSADTTTASGNEGPHPPGRKKKRDKGVVAARVQEMEINNDIQIIKEVNVEQNIEQGKLKERLENSDIHELVEGLQIGNDEKSAPEINESNNLDAGPPAASSGSKGKSHQRSQSDGSLYLSKTSESWVALPSNKHDDTSAEQHRMDLASSLNITDENDYTSANSMLAEHDSGSFNNTPNSSEVDVRAHGAGFTLKSAPPNFDIPEIANTAFKLRRAYSASQIHCNLEEVDMRHQEFMSIHTSRKLIPTEDSLPSNLT